MQVKEIVAEKLRAETFAPYGRVLAPHRQEPTKAGEGWRCFSNVDRIYADAPLMAGIVYCQQMPQIIEALEGHTSREELLWATDKDLVMLVSTPEDLDRAGRRPKIANTKAFLIGRGESVIIGKGTWHSPAFSVDGEPAKYFFLVEDKKDSVDQDRSPWIPFDEGAVRVIL